MSANEILDKLIGGQIKLSQALLYTKVLMADSTCSAQVTWVRNECDGYESRLDVPEYRRIPCQLYAHSSVAFVGEHTKPADAYGLDEVYQKECGLSLYTMYVTEGVESLEEFMNGSTDGTVSMSLPDNLNKAFRESNTNPSVAILQVYQQAPISYITGLLTSVKNELINILMPLAKEEMQGRMHEENNLMVSGEYKSVFISYSYDSHDHEMWVKHFVDVLKAHGVKVAFDKDLPYGSDIPSFMVNGIGESDVVLIIGTPMYMEKVRNSLTTGAKFEDVIITNSLMNDVGTTKFVPILREGTFRTSFAPLLEHRKGIDFTKEGAFEEKMEELLNRVLKW